MDSQDKKSLSNSEYLDLLAAAAFNKEHPSLKAIDELIAIVAKAIANLEKLSDD